MSKPKLDAVLARCVAAVNGPVEDIEVPKPVRDVSLAVVLTHALNVLLDLDLSPSDCAAGKQIIATGMQGQPGRVWWRLHPPPPGGYGTPELELMQWFCPWCEREVKARALIHKRSDIGQAILAHLITAGHPEEADL